VTRHARPRWPAVSASVASATRRTASAATTIAMEVAMAATPVSCAGPQRAAQMGTAGMRTGRGRAAARQPRFAEAACVVRVLTHVSRPGGAAADQTSTAAQISSAMALPTRAHRRWQMVLPSLQGTPCTTEAPVQPPLERRYASMGCAMQTTSAVMRTEPGRA
jgi:hypothetical protein